MSILSFRIDKVLNRTQNEFMKSVKAMEEYYVKSSISSTSDEDSIFSKKYDLAPKASNDFQVYLNHNSSFDDVVVRDENVVVQSY